MLIKQESVSSKKLGSLDIWQITNSFLNKSKSAVPPLFYGPEVFSSASDEATLISKSSNLDDLGISSPVFFLELIWNCIILL